MRIKRILRNGRLAGFLLVASLPDPTFHSDALCPGNGACLKISNAKYEFQGPEHTVEGGGPNAQPSRCTLPMFHPDMDPAKAPSGLGHISSDGHHFECMNPISMQQSFHV